MQKTATPVLPGSTFIPVCAIGASAGGVGALQEFFEQVPVDLGMAYVVIIHLSPNYPSQLSEILASRTAMPVEQVDDVAQLMANRVYVIPPDRELIIEGDNVAARPFQEPRGQRAPIDMFFRSVALGRGDGMAVVLTGAGSDGALGVRAVKEAGGVVFVQDPHDAQYPMMPRSAIATGVADFVAPIGKITKRIVEVMRSKNVVRAMTEEAAQDDIRRIMGFLRTRTGHDFSSYKRATVMRRVTRRMQVARRESLADYATYLVENPEEAQELFADLLISVTSFFRDPHAFEALAREAIGPLIRDHEDGQPIRVWVVGCATGEEAYSVAILMREEAQRQKKHPAIQIFASDLDEGALATAREGLYPRSIEADVSEERLERFFVKEGPHYRIRKEVRDLVLFASHSALRDPPFIHLDLVTCRNLLIYLEREVQKQLCALFAYGLKPGGYMFLGSAETVDATPELFRTLDRDARVYKAKPQVANNVPLLPQMPPEHRPPRPGPRRISHEPGHVLGAQHAAALEQTAPPSVLVDEAQRVLHLSASAGRFLQPSAGVFSNDLPSLVRSELRTDLQMGLRRAFERKEASLGLPVPVAFEGAARRVVLHIVPTGGHDDHAPAQALVFFLDGGPATPREEADSSGDGLRTEEVRQLQEELQVAQERLSAARHDHETALQELRAANEELQSMNEEYRSTSEELETSKEELQSINEELRTVNSELKSKFESISSAHSDLKNLIASTDVGTLFLDAELRIRMFTPTVAELFNITEIDLGRTITHFTHNLEFEGIEPDARRVLRDLAPLEREVAVRDGRWLMIRMRPYRTIDDRIDGVVISFVEVTELRQASDALRESEEKYRTLFESMDEGFLIAEVERDAEGQATDVFFVDANPAAAAMVKAELEGHRLSEIAPELDAYWRDIPARVIGSGSPERHELHAPSLDRWFDLHVSRVKVAEGGTRAAVLFQDITERRHGEAQLREAQELLTMATDAAHLGWGTWNFSENTATWDARGREMLGLNETETAMEDWISRIHPEDRPRVETHLADCLVEARPFDMEYRVVLPGDDERRIHGTGAFQREGEGRPARGAGLVRDVTERHRWEQSQRLLIQELNHRVKNMLAVVQSVAHQTRRSSGDIEAFFVAFEHRVRALALAHNLLTERSWDGADLRTLVKSTLATFSDPSLGRVRIEGPPVDLSPNAAISFTMALHELGTNALKYGSLSSPDGTVSVTWDLEPSDDRERLRFDWMERDGPKVAPPKRQGFGSRMLSKGIARELDGSVTVGYEETGLTCTMLFPTDGRFRRQ